jgi:hypothetical protein
MMNVTKRQALSLGLAAISLILCMSADLLLEIIGVVLGALTLGSVLYQIVTGAKPAYRIEIKSINLNNGDNVSATAVVSTANLVGFSFSLSRLEDQHHEEIKYKILYIGGAFQLMATNGSPAEFGFNFTKTSNQKKARAWIEITGRRTIFGNQKKVKTKWFSLVK